MNDQNPENDSVVIHLSEEAKKMQEEQGQTGTPDSERNPSVAAEQNATPSEDDGFAAFAPVAQDEPNAEPQEPAVDLDADVLQPVNESESELQQKINQLEEYARRQTADFKITGNKCKKRWGNPSNKPKIGCSPNGSKSWTTSNEPSTTSRKKIHSWISGMQAIFKHMLYTLERHDITPIEAADKPFDPNWHEAISMMQDRRKKTIRFPKWFKPVTYARVVCFAQRELSSSKTKTESAHECLLQRLLQDAQRRPKSRWRHHPKGFSKACSQIPPGR